MMNTKTDSLIPPESPFPRPPSLFELFKRDGRSDFVDPSYVPKEFRGRPSVTSTSFESSEEEDAIQAKVLVLYCGGTIGMKNINGSYSPVSDYLENAIRKLPMFHDEEYAKKTFHGNEDKTPLVMPLSKEKKRIIYYIYEYDPLLDSSNITMTDYAKMASDIHSNYDFFDSFIILHGTDTMSYTASALSFMLENLGKTVILTGSQIPIFETRSDGRENFCDALTIAGHYVIPEVTICFHRKLLRGNRSTKIDSGDFEAFTSYNLPPLAIFGIDIKVDWSSIFRPNKLEKFSANPLMCPNVSLLRLFPSITKTTVESFLKPPMQGLVIQSYGAGNGPDARKDLLKIFKEAYENGIILVNITQCSRGAVSAAYACGKALLDAGIIFGSDMTPEAALTKLAYILAKDELSLEEKRQMMENNLRGEMRVSEGKPAIDAKSLISYSLLGKLSTALKLNSDEDILLLRNTILPSLMCGAAKTGDLEIFKQIALSEGNIFSMTDYDRRTALHIASSEGHINVVKYLLENGASVHAKDRYGHTPLDDAIRFNHLEVIEMLKKTGAILKVPPVRLAMLLCYTVSINNFPMMEAWKIAGANLNSANYDKRTALHVAVNKRNLDMVKYLIKNGANPKLSDVNGASSIDIAKANKFDEILEILMTADDYLF